MKIVGGIARNAHFGSLYYDIWRKPRTKRSFWKLFVENFSEASHKTIILAASSLNFGGSFASGVFVVVFFFCGVFVVVFFCVVVFVCRCFCVVFLLWCFFVVLFLCRYFFCFCVFVVVFFFVVLFLLRFVCVFFCCCCFFLLSLLVFSLCLVFVQKCC